MSLVEHSLGPLKATKECIVHETEYHYSENKKRRVANPQITWPLGYSPKDEFTLWGTAAVIMSQEEPNVSIHCSARYLLRRLGFSQGGKNIRDLRKSIKRLGQARYFNENFYDPIRKETRCVGFGLLSHDMPEDKNSHRLWHVGIDPILYGLLEPKGGYLSFDLELCRKLTPMEQRLFLLLRKLFYRMEVTNPFDAWALSVHTLGCDDGQPMWKLRDNIKRCARKLESLGVITGLLISERHGRTNIKFIRGTYWDESTESSTLPTGLNQNPLYEGLTRIGLNEGRIRNVLRDYKAGTIREWLDVTQCGIENGHHFTNCPEAFFNHYIELGKQGKATAPDWYEKIRKSERERKSRQADNEFPYLVKGSQKTDNKSRDTFLDENRALIESILSDLTNHYVSGGESEPRARRNAETVLMGSLNKGVFAKKDHDELSRAGELIDLERLRESLIS